MLEDRLLIAYIYEKHYENGSEVGIPMLDTQKCGLRRLGMLFGHTVETVPD